MRILTIFALSANLWAVANSVISTEQTGATQANRPMTISRVFAKGEIANYPRPSVSGAVLTQWQSNVMTRWTDGSVQHALISFTQSFTANQALTTLFVNDAQPCHLGNQATCDAAAPSQSQILAFNSGNWGAAIQGTANSVMQSASARAMVTAGAWRFWIKGPLMNQIIVEDQSTALSFDYGWHDKHWTNLQYSVGDNTSTTIYLGYTADITSFPTQIKMDSEKMSVTALSGNQATVVRGAGVDGRITSASDSALDTTNVGAHTTTLAGPTNSGLEGGTQSTHPLGDYIVVSGATGCWAALNGVRQIGTLGLSDPKQFFVTVDTSSCSGSITGTVTYTTASSHSPVTPVRVDSYSAGSWIAAPSSIFKSLHPIFVVTQYTGWAGTKIDYILENIWTTKQQDQVYDLTLKSGAALGTTQLSKAAYVHTAQSRWRQTFWDGAIPGDVNTDYNFQYMISTQVLPNFDTTRNVAGTTAVSDEVTAFNGTDKGVLGGFGQWQQAFGTQGGRPDLGLFPRWVVRYLYTFAPSLRAVVFGNADVSGYIPVHYRESASGRFYDSASSVPAFAQTVTPDGRPTLCTNSIANSGGSDIIYPIGNVTNANWLPDVAHQASFTFVPYLLTGDWYYLTEGYYWAAFDTTFSTPGTCVFCRHDDWGFLNESGVEPRGIAWGARNIAHAAFMAPDGSVEKAEWTQKLNYNIAVFEGAYGITSGTYPATPQYAWGQGVLLNNKSNTLHIQSRNTNYGVYAPYVQTSLACKSSANWMPQMVSMVWSHIDELGFSQVHPLRVGVYGLLLNQVLGNIGNAYMSGELEIPMVDKVLDPTCTNGANNFFSTPSQIAAAYQSSYIAGAQTEWNNRVTDAEFGYPQITYAAASSLPTLFGTQGQTAWNWMTTEFGADGGLAAQSANPKWAFLPRAISSVSNILTISGPVVMSGPISIRSH